MIAASEISMGIDRKVFLVLSIPMAIINCVDPEEEKESRDLSSSSRE